MAISGPLTGGPRCPLIYLCYLALILVPLTTAVNDIHFQVMEEQGPGTLVGNIPNVWDISPEHSSDVQYMLSDQGSSVEDALALFSIHATSGELRTATRIDRDDLCSFLNTCTVQLGIGIVSSSRYELISVSVEIIDINDNSPTFPLDTENIGIPENTAVNTLFPLTEAIDYDSSSNGLQSYRLQPVSEHFALVTETSLDGSIDVQLIVMRALDRELHDSFAFQLVATDAGSPARSATMQLNITVVDINDNVARFTQDEYAFSVDEDIAVGSVVATVRADDPDLGQNGRVAYELSTRTQALHGQTFSINNDGEIRLLRELDYETTTVYELTVNARDSAPNARRSSAKVVLRVRDVNDFSPQITVTRRPGSTQAAVVEGAPLDTFIAHVSVIDRDAGINGQVQCSLNNTRFQLNSESEPTQFTLVTAFRFDRETIATDWVTIICSDQGAPALTSEETVMVVISDINDNPPVFDKALYAVVLRENDAVGIFVSAVTARDADSGVNAVINYEIKENASRSRFEIGGTGLITTLASLDHEEQALYSFRVVARDGGSPVRSAETTMQVQLLDVNDSPPRFARHSFEFEVQEELAAGTDIGTLAATDADSAPYDTIHYTFLSDAFALRAMFDLDVASGHIRSKVPFDRETKPIYEFQVIAYNPDLPILNSTTTVSVTITDVNDESPVFTFPSEENNTLHIRSDMRQGEQVTQAQAHDPDVGSNAWLSYSIERGNEEGFFEIDETTGIITMAKGLSKGSTKNFNLSLQVRDHGSPPQAAVETLLVVASGVGGPAPEEARMSANLLILVTLVSISGVLVVLLLVAILWLVYKARFRRTKTPKYYAHQSSSDKLGCKVQIIDRLDTLATNPGDLSSSFREQPFHDIQPKGGKSREAPLHSHNSADSGFDEHNDVTRVQHGRHVSFGVAREPTIDEGSEPASDNPAFARDAQEFETSSSSGSEEGSNTDSGCVLSESLQEQHDQPQLPLRTYPPRRAPASNPRPASSPHTALYPITALPHPSQTQPPTLRPRNKSDSENAHTSFSSGYKELHKPEIKNCAIKVRYVDNRLGESFDRRSEDADACVQVLRQGHKSAALTRNFSDCNSVLRYKIRNPSSELTDNSSSTSGSYMITTDEHGMTLC